MSGGYAPLSGVLIQERVAQTFWGDVEANVQFRAGHTYAGNPVACAVGSRRSASCSSATSSTTRGAWAPCSRRGSKRSPSGIRASSKCAATGLLLAVEFAQDRATREPFPEAVKFGARVHRAARARGLLIREGPEFVVLAPPLVIDEADVDEIVGLMDLAIGDAVASLRVEPAATSSKESR